MLLLACAYFACSRHRGEKRPCHLDGAATPVSHLLARRHELNVPKCIQGAEQNIEFVLRHGR
jgi:hypothetical protein